MENATFENAFPTEKQCFSIAMLVYRKVEEVVGCIMLHAILAVSNFGTRPIWSMYGIHLSRFG